MANPSGKTILFVCTGNTCRSPMAAAIAERMISEAGDSLRHVHALSAGVAATEGSPMTPEASAALEKIGVQASGHRSAPLSADLIRAADVIYAMTASHADAIRRIDPEAASKVFPLDPDGADIPDPIGQSQRIYDEAAELISAHVATRLEEMKES